MGGGAQELRLDMWVLKAGLRRGLGLSLGAQLVTLRERCKGWHLRAGEGRWLEKVRVVYRAGRRQGSAGLVRGSACAGRGGEREPLCPLGHVPAPSASTTWRHRLFHPLEFRPPVLEPDFHLERERSSISWLVETKVGDRVGLGLGRMSGRVDDGVLERVG